MNGIVKKVKKGLKIGIASVLIALSIGGSVVGYSNVKLADYSTNEEIESFAQELSCDLSYATKVDDRYLIKEHNEDEPIYVCIDESITEEEKSVAIDALDYVFSFVSKINSKYRYEIVDNNTYNLKVYKSRIYIGEGNCERENNFGEIDENRGLATRKVSNLSKLTNKRVTNENSIFFNRDKMLSLEGLKKTLIHELAHVFSKNDVYTVAINATTDKHYGNTFMLEGSNSEKMGIISPNDLRVWASIYADEDSNKKEIKKMIAEYDQFYYQTYSSFCKEKVETDEDVYLYNFELNDTLHVTYLDGTKQMYGYKFVVFEDEYEFSIFDLNTNKQLEFATGNVERVNGTIVLKDVELNKGLRPLDANESYSGGYVQDLIILSKDDKICWFDLSCNDLRRYCSVYEIEKDMGL